MQSFSIRPSFLISFCPSANIYCTNLDGKTYRAHMVCEATQGEGAEGLLRIIDLGHSDLLYGYLFTAHFKMAKNLTGVKAFEYIRPFHWNNLSDSV